MPPLANSMADKNVCPTVSSQRAAGDGICFPSVADHTAPLGGADSMALARAAPAREGSVPQSLARPAAIGDPKARMADAADLAGPCTSLPAHGDPRRGQASCWPTSIRTPNLRHHRLRHDHVG